MTPPFELQLYTGAEMLKVLRNAELVIDGFNTKMRVEYDDQDLKGLMETVQRRNTKFKSSAERDCRGNGRR